MLILTTKLYPPPARPEQVARPLLLARLDEGHRSGHRLTVLIAPAGYGKTTLLSAWVARQPAPTAWLSLDDGDNDPVRFLTHVVAALQSVNSHTGTDVLRLLEAGQAPLDGATLTTLVNELSRAPADTTLVLDDLHLIDHPPVLEALAFVLDHLPRQLHLVLASRIEPPLPLARLRARNELIELRADDLRFTPSEAAAFLNQVMGLGLSADDVAVLERRTEGWAAGLQLAALSLQGRREGAAFIRAFSGDHRHVVEYLVEEVLRSQPDDVRRFLLDTSILERLNGALCESITGQTGGRARLEALERANLFLIPLDDRRHWYRYHPLFSGALQAQLKAEDPDRVGLLHRRASDWHARHGAMADAIHHALAGADAGRAADLLEGIVPDLRRSRQEAQLLTWFRALPAALLDQRPVLSAQFAGVLLLNGLLEGVEARLRAAERGLVGGGRAPGVVVVDEVEYRRLPGAIAAYRAALALRQGAAAAAATHARQALEQLADDDHLERGAAWSLLGLARWAQGDLAGAEQAYGHGITGLQEARHLSDVLGCALALADIRQAQGRLQAARDTYTYALELTQAPGAPVLRGTADMLVGLSDLHREANDVQAALACLEASHRLGNHAGLPQNPYRTCLVQARIKQAQEDLPGALELLAQAERRYAGDLSPNVRPLAAWRVRLWVAAGRLEEAAGWMRAHGPTIDDPLTYAHEFEHFTLVRVLLALGRAGAPQVTWPDLLRLLARLQQSAEVGGRLGSVIESRLFAALVHQADGNLSAAWEAFDPALLLAEPEGYWRLFLDEGADMVRLLRAASQRPNSPAFASRLVGAVSQHVSAGAAPSPGPVAVPPLVEPLSAREREVLRLLRTDLSGPEIARELHVSLNTFNSHTRSIYAKLGVNNRRAAVRRADDLRITS